ncbi:MAG: hypothetical protein QFX32_08505 [Methanolinea sp.]|nr:hypothetical protein [Methanolinea sp.]
MRNEEDLAAFLQAHPVKVRRLARACGGRCEHCGESFPVGHLSVYVLDPPAGTPWPGGGRGDRILVLCPACHAAFSGGKVPWESAAVLVGLRAEETARAMEKILGSAPRTYVPPGGRDAAEIFDDAVRGTGPDLCLNGG